MHSPKGNALEENLNDLHTNVVKIAWHPFASCVALGFADGNAVPPLACQIKAIIVITFKNNPQSFFIKGLFACIHWMIICATMSLKSTNHKSRACISREMAPD